MICQGLVFGKVIRQEHQGKSDASLNAKGPAEQAAGTFAKSKMLVPEMEFNDRFSLFESHSTRESDRAFTQSLRNA
jgi:hypothetical protein